MRMETVAAIFGRLLQALRIQHRRTANELMHDPTARLRPGIGFALGLFNVLLATYSGGALYVRLVRQIGPAPWTFVAMEILGLTLSVLAVVAGVAIQFTKARWLQWRLVAAIVLLTGGSISAAIIANEIIQAS